MADGVALPATGVTAATDDAGAAGHVQIIKLAISTDGSATVIPADATNGLDVDVTRVIPGVTATALGKAEDAAHVSGDTGVFILAVRQDTLAALAGTTGDYTGLSVDATGRLYVTGPVVGSDAEDAALAAAPVRIAGRAHSTVPTAMSADNDVVTPWHDRNGAAVVVPQPRQIRLTATPTISTTAYATGDQVGGIMTFASAAIFTGRAGQIVGATLVDKGKQKATLEMWLFAVSPTLVGSDNAAFDILDANVLTALPFGVIDFTAADYKDMSSSSFCMGEVSGGPVTIPFVTSATASIFGVFVVRGTPTYASTSDLTVDLIINQF